MVAQVSRGAGVGVRVVKNDLTKLHAMTKALGQVGDFEIEVGYYDGQTYDDGTPVAAVAAWHEFGTQNMPQRAFFRSALAENKRTIQKASADALKKVLQRKKTPEQGAAMIARALGKIIYQKLVRASSWATPLAASTIARKGHSRILVDTETLRNELTWRVVKKGLVVAEGKAKNVRVNL